MYFSQIAKNICRRLQNIFVKIAHIFVLITNVFVTSFISIISMPIQYCNALVYFYNQSISCWCDWWRWWWLLVFSQDWPLAGWPWVPQALTLMTILQCAAAANFYMKHNAIRVRDAVEFIHTNKEEQTHSAHFWPRAPFFYEYEEGILYFINYR